MAKERKSTPLPVNKTKIICTVGPSSDSPDVLVGMIRAGMNIARINFSHGAFEYNKRVIGAVRAAAAEAGRRVAVMADLPGPKIRIGMLGQEPVELKQGSVFTLTTEKIIGDRDRVSVSFPGLPGVVKPGDTLFLNDGLIQLEVLKVDGAEVQCRVLAGGELRSRKGLNLPGIELGVGAFTDHDRRCMQFALENGVDVISQSFVESAADIAALRSAASTFGYSPFVIAKIERSRALDRIEEILESADAIMVARGDLGVEIPIEEIATVQKLLVHKANLRGKPVIIATQMLQSMTGNGRPTRAEATDVANAILDGADCVMLSEESATGRYPIDSVAVMARIAATTESHRPRFHLKEELLRENTDTNISLPDLISHIVETVFAHAAPAAVFVPTKSGATARSISRFRLPVWIAAVSTQEVTCQRLQFTYGVYPVHEETYPEEWCGYARRWLDSHDIRGAIAVLTEGPSPRHPEANHRIEIIDLRKE